MGYKELIKKVQIYSGFSDSESKDALDCLVETLAVRLDETDRKDFASHLPEELQDMALAVYPSNENSRVDLIEQFAEFQNVEPKRARKQIQAAWHALKDNVTRREIEHLQHQLPRPLDHLLR